MQVKQLLCDVMRMVGRADVAENCASEDISPSSSRALGAMLLCLNAVMDELARGYFPLKAEEALTSEDGSFAFSDFSRTPYKILSVRSAGGGRVAWSAKPSALVADAKDIVVAYEYVPERLALDDDFAYPHGAVSCSLVSYGVAAEYMLIEGDVARAEAWEEKYRGEIDRQLSLLPARGCVPPRRWL